MGSLLPSETQPSLPPRLPALALGRTMPGTFQIQGLLYITSPAFLGYKPLSIPKLFLRAPTTNARGVDPEAGRRSREESWPTVSPCAPVTLGFWNGCGAGVGVGPPNSPPLPASLQWEGRGGLADCRAAVGGPCLPPAQGVLWQSLEPRVPGTELGTWSGARYIIPRTRKTQITPAT